MVEPSDSRVAVYIDFDNIVISRYDEVFGRESFKKDKARSIGAPKDGAAPDPTSPAGRAVVDVGAILDYATSFGSVVISRAFADWSSPANSKYSRQLVDRAVDLTQMFPTAAYQKNGADIRLSVDVVEDMFRLPEITHVVIVAGDSDFIPLAQRCKRLGRYVIGIGVKGATSVQLAAACNEFKFYGELPGVVPAPKQTAPATEPVHATAEPVAEKPAGRRRASKPQDAADPETIDSVDPKLSATQLLIRAMSLGHDKSDEEWLHSSSVKLQMMRLDPSFNEKSLGFKSFSEFVKSRSSQVEIDADASGRIRLRDTAPSEA
jgi:NYN domain/OST-HTH/LOTUS domain